MEELLKNKEVHKLFESWGKRRGFYKVAEELAKALEALASSLNLPNRGHLFPMSEQLMEKSRLQLTLTSTRKISKKKIEKNLANLAKTAITNKEKFNKCIEQEKDQWLKEATRFSKQYIERDWPWLPRELVDVFIRRVEGYAYFGTEITLVYRTQNGPKPSASFLKKLEKIKDENPQNPQLEQAANKLLNFESEKSGQDLPRTRMPREKATQSLKRNTVWWYQNKIKKISIRKLAKAYYTEQHLQDSSSPTPPDSDYRPLVSRGIKETERLLNLSFSD